MTTTKKDRLVKQYAELEDRIEDAAGSVVWELADWLAANVPPAQGERTELRPSGAEVTIADLAAEGYRTARWLRRLRKVALDTAADRMPDVSVRVYEQALTGRTLDEANDYLTKRGTKLRDVSGPMESTDALAKQLAKRTPKERAEVAQKVAEIDEVESDERHAETRQSIIDQQVADGKDPIDALGADLNRQHAHKRAGIAMRLQNALDNLVTAEKDISESMLPEDLKRFEKLVPAIVEATEALDHTYNARKAGV